MARRVIVSKCLLGENCRYEGSNCLDEELIKCLGGYEIIGLCPENLGGLIGERGPFEILGEPDKVFLGKAKVVNTEGKNVTKNFLKGACKTVSIAKKKSVKLAILKSKSPSCSPDYIYDGTFRKKLRKGKGVACLLLEQQGIKVVSSNEFKQVHKIKRRG